MGTITLVLTLLISLTMDAFFILSMMLALNGFAGGTKFFSVFTVALPFKSLVVSLASRWSVVLLCETRFFKSVTASILLVLLTVVAFSIINLVAGVFGTLVLLGIAESSRPRRL